MWKLLQITHNVPKFELEKYVKAILKSGKIVKTNNITLDKRNEIREIRQTYTLW